MTVHGPERPGPDYPAEWDREPEECVMDACCEVDGSPRCNDCPAGPLPPAEASRCWAMADDEDPDCPIGSARCVRDAGHDEDHVFEAAP